MGRDASRQPGDLQDLMIHETAVAWLDYRLQITKPKKEWEESEDAFAKRLRDACAHVNENHDIDSLSRELPQRLDDLIELEGDRLSK